MLDRREYEVLGINFCSVLDDIASHWKARWLMSTCVQTGISKVLTAKVPTSLEVPNTLQRGFHC